MWRLLPFLLLSSHSASAVSVCCPISVVKTRIEGNAVSPYRGLFHGLHTIFYTEGIRGLYTGLIPSIMKDSPYSAVYLLCYSRLKTLFTDWDTTLGLSRHLPSILSTPLTHAASGQHPVIQFSAAFIAGGLSTTLFQPTEVIKTRLQLARLNMLTHEFAPIGAPIPSIPSTGSSSTSSTSVAHLSPSSSHSSSPSHPPRHRVTQMVRLIYREDGLSGFMRGLLPRIIKRSLSNACGWMMFEQMVQFWSGTTGL